MNTPKLSMLSSNIAFEPSPTIPGATSWDKSSIKRNLALTVSRQEFWHIVPVGTDLEEAVTEKLPDNLCMTLNNIYLGKGIFCPSVLLEGKDILQRRKSVNEEIFEEIRAIEYSNLPCRYKCIYLFKNRYDAEEKNLVWFGIVSAHEFSVFKTLYCFYYTTRFY